LLETSHRNGFDHPGDGRKPVLTLVSICKWSNTAEKQGQTVCCFRRSSWFGVRRLFWVDSWLVGSAGVTSLQILECCGKGQQAELLPRAAAGGHS